MKTGRGKQSPGTVSELARGRKAVKALDDLVNRCEVFLHALDACRNLCVTGKVLQAEQADPRVKVVLTGKQLAEQRCATVQEVFDFARDCFQQAFSASISKAKELLEPAGEAEGA